MSQLYSLAYLAENADKLPPDTVERLVMVMGSEGVLKHLPGMHDQSTHTPKAYAGRAGRIKESTVNKARSRVDAEIDALAKREGVTHEEVVARVEGVVDELTDGPISMMRSEESVMRLLDAGRMRNAHESGTRHPVFLNGADYMDIRAKVERSNFEIGDNADSSEYPLYGFVSSGITTSQETFGNVEIVLKDSVKTRTTVMVGDSFDAQTSDPVVVKHMSMGFRDYGELNAAPSPANGPIDRASWNVMHVEDMYRGRISRISYVEAQIHGGLVVDDIDHLIWRGDGRPPLSLSDAASGAGLEVHTGG